MAGEAAGRETVEVEAGGLQSQKRKHKKKEKNQKVEKEGHFVWQTPDQAPVAAVQEDDMFAESWPEDALARTYMWEPKWHDS